MSTTGPSASIRMLLSDGEWHEFHELYAAARLAIPPERAVRQVLRERDRARRAWLRRSGNAGRQRECPGRTPHTGAAAVEYGRRRLTLYLLGSMGAERRGRGQDGVYRLPGGVPNWNSPSYAQASDA